MISLARGASAMRTSMPSKWLRTNAASLWPSGTSSATPGPPRFLEEGISAAPCPEPCAPARRASDAAPRPRVRARRSPRRRPLCRSSPRVAPSMPSAATARVGEQLAQFLADLDQLEKILDIAAGERIFDHRDRSRPPRRRFDGAIHLDTGLFNESHELSNLRLSSQPIQSLDLVPPGRRRDRARVGQSSSPSASRFRRRAARRRRRPRSRRNGCARRKH